MGQVTQALAILNTRADSIRVFEALSEEDALYLSTWLCPAHRKCVIAEINRRLDAGLPCHLVATQVVEAGVDISFPLVLRAFGPLDSIVQAAGRCNRNGELKGLGSCLVFELEGGKTPPGPYATAVTVTQRFIPSRLSNLDDPTLQGEYSKAFLAGTGTDRIYKGPHGGTTTIQKSRREWDFPSVAAHSGLIQDDTTPVAIWRYDSELVDRTLAAVRFGKSPRLAARTLGPVSVSLREGELREAIRKVLVEEREPGFFVWTGPYDGVLGIAGNVVYEPTDLIS